jgi:hypothetical protein
LEAKVAVLIARHDLIFGRWVQPFLKGKANSGDRAMSAGYWSFSRAMSAGYWSFSRDTDHMSLVGDVTVE